MGSRSRARHAALRYAAERELLAIWGEGLPKPRWEAEKLKKDEGCDSDRMDCFLRRGAHHWSMIVHRFAPFDVCRYGDGLLDAGDDRLCGNDVRFDDRAA